VPLTRPRADGNIVLLTQLWEGQKATVLQLPAQPTTPAELETQRRVEYIGRCLLEPGRGNSKRPYG